MPLLGKHVRDVSSGFTGVAIARIEQLNRNVRFCVQKFSTDGEKMGEAYNVDQHTLVQITDQPGLTSLEVVPPTSLYEHVKLGNKVEDVISGIKGIATQRVTFLNGCIHFTVEGKADKNGDPKSWNVEAVRLQVIGDGIASTIEVPPVNPVTRMAAGGPTTRATQAPVRRN